MKVVALISGGKDSMYNIMQCLAAGHEIVALANLVPSSKTEVDSYMYQSVGFEAIDLISCAMELPLFRKETSGKSIQQQKIYTKTKDDEVEDLYELLESIKEEIDFEAVSVGAILSDYQRIRVENVCSRLGLVPLAYLWQMNQQDLLDEMINCEVDAIIIKVAGLGLDPHKHLGRSLSSLQSHLINMHEKYGLHICGEGGEYETLTLDCPLFKSRIVVVESEIIMHSDNHIAPVGYLKFNKLELENKLPILKLQDRLQGLPLKDCDGYVTDQGEDVKDLNCDELDSDNISETKEEFQIDMIPKSSANQHVSICKTSGGWLWVAGIRGEENGNSMKKAFDTLISCLSAHNHDLSNICSVTMFISNMKSFVELNKSYSSYFNFPNPPTRACVEVPLNQDCPLVLEVISWRSPDCDSPLERSTLHVQSRSHWAPANIGPYSQAVKVGDLIHLAGQIGLIPGNLEIVDGGVKSQCRLALRHIERLLLAVDPNMNLRNVVQGICYVTNISSIQQVRRLWEEKTNNGIVDYVVVSDLPKSALVEWHVWAHKFNHLFEYEETGRCIDDKNWLISIIRRWNHENSLSAIVCHLEKTNVNEESILDKEIFVECIKYTLQKLKQGHVNESVPVYNLKIFYPMSKTLHVDDYSIYLENIDHVSLSYTFVPVVYCKNENTYLSICGTKNE